MISTLLMPMLCFVGSESMYMCIICITTLLGISICDELNFRVDQKRATKSTTQHNYIVDSYLVDYARKGKKHINKHIKHLSIQIYKYIYVYV